MSRLDEIRARVAAATPGPWHVWLGESNREPCHVALVDDIAIVPEQEVRSPDADATFIANSHTDLAYLLAEVEQLTRERDEQARAADLWCRVAIDASPSQEAVTAAYEKEATAYRREGVAFATACWPSPKLATEPESKDTSSQAALVGDAFGVVKPEAFCHICNHGGHEREECPYVR